MGTARKTKTEPAPPISHQPQSPAPVDYCPGCERNRSMDDWALRRDEAMPPEGVFVCSECRDNGTEIQVMIFEELPPQDQKILRDLMRFGNFEEAARANGISAERLRTRLAGKQSRGKQDNKLFREAWKELLHIEGLDLLSVVRIMKLQLYAREPKWNPGLKRWDYFPDNKTRQRAAAWLAKMHGVEPTRAASQKAKGEAPVQVHLHTNVGAGEAPQLQAKSMGYTIPAHVQEAEYEEVE